MDFDEIINIRTRKPLGFNRVDDTVGHTGIYACGDRVKLKPLWQCSGRRSKNPATLVVRSVK